MVRITISDFYTANLPEIAQKLDEDYYDLIESYCGDIEAAIANFDDTEEHASSTLYISLCLKLVEKIKHHIHLRKLTTLPYIHQLYEKLTAHHDCSACEDGCQINHHLKAGGIKEMHRQVKEILTRLQMVAKPLYAAYTPVNTFSQLKDDMVSLDTKLTELFYLEEAVLLPRILEAQRKIHVRS